VVGLAHVGARIGEPGLLIHTTRGDVFVSTYVNPEIPSVVAGLLKSCDIPGGLEKDLRYISWRKFMMNNAFNAVTALTQTTMGEAVSAPYLKKVLKGCMEETLRISRAEGVSLPDEIIEKTLEAGLTYDRIFTSMYQDVKAGKPTEHEALNGVICRLGIKHGIPTPYNDTLYALLEHRSRQLEKV
jgi:2-dehydropantoate 2-reductase